MKNILLLFILFSLLITSCDDEQGDAPIIDVEYIYVNFKKAENNSIPLHKGDTVDLYVTYQASENTTLSTAITRVECAGEVENNGFETSVFYYDKNDVSTSNIGSNLSDCTLRFIDRVSSTRVILRTILKSPIADEFKFQLYLNTSDMGIKKEVEFELENIETEN